MIVAIMFDEIIVRLEYTGDNMFETFLDSLVGNLYIVGNPQPT